MKEQENELNETEREKKLNSEVKTKTDENRKNEKQRRMIIIKHHHHYQH